MKDRAMQALYLFALDPVAETRADPHSYGFRKHRSTADAIARCQEIFSQEKRSWWILEADIEKCFETISHDWLLQHIPLDRKVLQDWLSADYLERGTHYPAEQGLSQGGIISPTLMNMTLDGLEGVVAGVVKRRRRTIPISLVRYADDFLVISSSKSLLRHEVKPCIETFLSERGMKLSEEKTSLTHLKQGFEFLGFHLRYMKGKLSLAPAPGNFEKVVVKISKAIQANRESSPERLIQVLTPIIRGWADYYKQVEERKLFRKLDQQVAKLLWNWALAQHTGLFKRRQARQYFVDGHDRIRIFVDAEGHPVFRARELPQKIHPPIDPAL